ncbi:MAG: hypothetical protein ACXVBE_06375 [Bdellovibrionota bacterium]
MLLLLSFLMSALPSEAAVCMEEYGKVMPASQVSQSAQYSIILPSTTEEIENGFTLKLNSWKNEFKPDVTKRKLIRIQEDPAALYDYSDYFSSLYRKAESLRQAHEIFSSAHIAPASIRNFESALRKLSEEAQTRSSPQKVKKMAAAAELILAKFLKKNDLAEFKAASPAALLEKARGAAAQISALTDQELPTPKNIGKLSSAINELLLLNLGSGPDKSEALIGLRDDLRKLDREFIRQSKDGEIDYSKQQIFLNPLLATKLTQLKKELEALPNFSGALPK